MKLTNSRCQCAACGLYFTSTSAFDKHRAWANESGVTHIGRGARPQEYDNRVCVDPKEAGLMERKGVFGWPSTPTFDATTFEHAVAV